MKNLFEYLSFWVDHFLHPELELTYGDLEDTFDFAIYSLHTDYGVSARLAKKFPINLEDVDKLFHYMLCSLKRSDGHAYEGRFHSDGRFILN